MPTWKVCTSALHEGQSEFINLDNVAKMTAHPQGTVITFAGLDSVTALVRESPFEITGARG